MAIGIYMFINMVNNKKYIGCSIDLKRRKWSHYCSLRHNRHCNIHFQNAWNKYGEENFTYQVIEEIAQSDNLIEILSERERYYISLYQTTNPDFGYNILSGGVTQANWPQPLVDREREYWSQKTGKPIYQIDVISGNKKEWNGFKEACKIAGFDKGAVHTCLRNKGGMCGGFFWIRQEDYYEGVEQDYLLKKFSFKLKCIKYSVGKYDKSNVLLKIYNRFRDTTADGFDEELVRRCCEWNTIRGKDYSHLGFVWRIIDYPYYDEEVCGRL